MRLAVLSDTHLGSPSPRLTEEFDTTLQHMDAVLHCGDHTGESVWAYLNGHPAFYAVRGNMDGHFGDGILPATRVLDLNGFRVGMLHGDGLGSTDPFRWIADILRTDVDLLCYGHTHRRDLQSAESATVLNPGSFRLPRGNSKAGYAVLELDRTVGIGVEWKDVW